jgi:hypothetical protein
VDANEKFVRDNVGDVSTVLNWAGCPSLVAVRLLDFKVEFAYEDFTECWDKAAMFIREHRKKIADVEEEIILIGDRIPAPPMPEDDRVPKVLAWKRILTREQAVLAELKKGMKDGR